MNAIVSILDLEELSRKGKMNDVSSLVSACHPAPCNLKSI